VTEATRARRCRAAEILKAENVSCAPGALPAPAIAAVAKLGPSTIVSIHEIRECFKYLILHHVLFVNAN
jgi:hypothetical protein